MSLVEIHLLGVPLGLHRATVEHSAEVMREFSHLVEGPTASHAPARLIELNRVLEERFGPFTRATTDELEEALASGRESVDLVFRLPAEAGAAARQVGELWEEVDRYCESGDWLLALRTPPDARLYRDWFLGEFARQAAGETPTSWPDWSTARNPS